MKPKGRVPGSTRAGGELFDRPKYTRNKKHPEIYDEDLRVCRNCGEIRDRSELHNLGIEGWVCSAFCNIEIKE
jgi:hypothetical protein